MTERTRGRPQKALVTREKIATAALGIVERKGYGNLTMAAVARALGVAPSALYNHVRGKNELIFLVQDAVMDQVDTSALEECLNGTLAPAEALTRWAHSYRDVFSRHAPLISHIATMPIFGTRETVGMYELTVQVMLRAGVAEPQVMDAVVALEAFIFGSAYDVAAPADIFDVPDHIDGAPGLRRVLAVREPSGSADGRNPYADPPFERGLEALIDALLP